MADGPYEQIDGRDFEIDAVRKIEDGVTTRTNIVSLFGEPWKAIVKPSGEEYILYFSEIRRVTIASSWFRTKKYIKIVRYKLELEVLDQIVKSHNYNVSSDNNFDKN